MKKAASLCLEDSWFTSGWAHYPSEWIPVCFFSWKRGQCGTEKNKPFVYFPGSNTPLHECLHVLWNSVFVWWGVNVPSWQWIWHCFIKYFKCLSVSAYVLYLYIYLQVSKSSSPAVAVSIRWSFVICFKGRGAKLLYIMS